MQPVRGLRRGMQKVQAITITKDKPDGASIFSEYKNIAVFIEQRGGEMAGVSFEMLGEGRKLADRLGERLVAVLLGHGMRKQAEELVKYGADKVCTWTARTARNSRTTFTAS